MTFNNIERSGAQFYFNMRVLQAPHRTMKRMRKEKPPLQRHPLNWAIGRVPQPSDAPRCVLPGLSSSPCSSTRVSGVILWNKQDG